jgi:calcium-dependent protein kinase
MGQNLSKYFCCNEYFNKNNKIKLLNTRKVQRNVFKIEDKNTNNNYNNSDFPIEYMFDINESVTNLKDLKINKSIIISRKKGLPSEEYLILKELGEGSFGKVFKVANKITNNIRAIKVIKKFNLEKNYNKSKLYDEIKILKDVDHPNIIKIFEFFEDDENYYIVSEYCPEGDLAEMLGKLNTFNEKIVKFLMFQILSAVFYLHSNRIFHGDLKLENILLENLSIRSYLSNLTNTINNYQSYNENKNYNDNYNNNINENKGLNYEKYNSDKLNIPHSHAKFYESTNKDLINNFNDFKIKKTISSISNINKNEETIITYPLNLENDNFKYDYENNNNDNNDNYNKKKQNEKINNKEKSSIINLNKRKIQFFNFNKSNQLAKFYYKTNNYNEKIYENYNENNNDYFNNNFYQNKENKFSEYATENLNIDKNIHNDNNNDNYTNYNNKKIYEKKLKEKISFYNNYNDAINDDFNTQKDNLIDIIGEKIEKSENKAEDEKNLTNEDITIIEDRNFKSENENLYYEDNDNENLMGSKNKNNLNTKYNKIKIPNLNLHDFNNYQTTNKNFELNLNIDNYNGNFNSNEIALNSKKINIEEYLNKNNNYDNNKIKGKFSKELNEINISDDSRTIESSNNHISLRNFIEKTNDFNKIVNNNIDYNINITNINDLDIYKTYREEVTEENCMKNLMNYEIKIIDFGCSKIFKKGGKNFNEIIGTALYIAPEVIQNNYNEKCDLWSIGVIMYFLLVGFPPFFSMSDSEIFSQILNCDYSFEYPEFNGISSEAKDLISKLLTVNPNERLSASQALEHEFFTEISSNRINHQSNLDYSILNNLKKNKKEFKFQRAVVSYLAYNFASKDEIINLRKIFKSIDLNCDGKISKEELLYAFSELNLDIDENELNEIIEVIDMDKSGFIEYEEFITSLINKRKLLTEQNLKCAFDLFDLDKNKKISMDEIKNILIGNHIKKNISEDFTIDLKKDFNLGHDQEINFEEFKNIIFQILKDE